MSIHTENLARRIAAQILLAMAEQSMTFADVAKNLSDHQASANKADVQDIVSDLMLGRNVSLALVAQLAWGVNRSIDVHLGPYGQPELAAQKTENQTEDNVPRIDGKDLTLEDRGRVVMALRGSRGGTLGLLETWDGATGKASVMVANSVTSTFSLNNLTFATEDEVRNSEFWKGVGHTPIYAGEKK